MPNGRDLTRSARELNAGLARTGQNRRMVGEVPQTRRRAVNEAIFREVNEQIASLAASRDQIEIVCECSTLGCATPLVVTAERYEAARADASTFIVVPGHYDLSLERVVADYGEYLFVQKIGQAAADARATDPRS